LFIVVTSSKCNYFGIEKTACLMDKRYYFGIRFSGQGNWHTRYKRVCPFLWWAGIAAKRRKGRSPLYGTK